MTFEEAMRKLGHLRSIRSAIAGLLETAMAVQAEDPALLTAIYDAGDKAALEELRDKTQAAIDAVLNMVVT